MKILWASRHELDPDALIALKKGLFVLCGINSDDIEVESREILWPADSKGCLQMAYDLYDLYETVEGEAIFFGIFPAQAIEALNSYDLAGMVQVYSPVSVPETEPDVKKPRPFRFVRWARIV